MGLPRKKVFKAPRDMLKDSPYAPPLPEPRIAWQCADCGYNHNLTHWPWCSRCGCRQHKIGGNVIIRRQK